MALLLKRFVFVCFCAGLSSFVSQARAKLELWVSYDHLVKLLVLFTKVAFFPEDADWVVSCDTMWHTSEVLGRAKQSLGEAFTASWIPRTEDTSETPCCTEGGHPF